MCNNYIDYHQVSRAMQKYRIKHNHDAVLWFAVIELSLQIYSMHVPIFHMVV